MGNLSVNELKDLVKLNTSKYREEQNRFIVEGPHLVSEAKNLGILLEAYTISEAYSGKMITEAEMKKLSSTATLPPQIGVCRMDLKANLANRILILDAIQDPGNMGTLMRSAVAFGFDTIFIGTGSVDIFNSKVIRSSQGAFFKLNYQFGSVCDFIKQKLNGYKIYSTDVTKGTDVRKIPYQEKVAIILGNEGNGVSLEVRKLNLDNLHINLKNTESLNVGIAGSILMYELGNKDFS